AHTRGDRVPDRYRGLLKGQATQGYCQEEKLIDAVILHPGRKVLHGVQHQPAEHLVPPEVTLHVDALGTLGQGLPDRIARLDPAGIYVKRDFRWYEVLSRLMLDA